MQKISISAPSADLLMWKHSDPLKSARCEISVTTGCEAVVLLKKDPWEEILPDNDVEMFLTKNIESVYGIRMQTVDGISWAMVNIPSIDENSVSCILGGGGLLSFCVRHSRKLVQAMAGVDSTTYDVMDKILSRCINAIARKHLSRINFTSLDYDSLSENIFVDLRGEYDSFGLRLERVVVDRVIRVR